MTICTYKDCKKAGIHKRGSEAILCSEHAKEWREKFANPESPAGAMLGTWARATHKVRDKQINRIMGVS